MATLGVNTFLWTTTWTVRRSAVELVRRIKGMGFDAVQIPILNTEALNPAWLRPLLAEAGLRCYISAGLKPETDVTSVDDDTRRRGVEYLVRCLKIANEMGCGFLSGSFHSVFGMRKNGLGNTTPLYGSVSARAPQ